MAELPIVAKRMFLEEQKNECLKKIYRNDVDEIRLQFIIDKMSATKSPLPEVEQAINEYKAEIRKFKADTVTLSDYVTVLEGLISDLDLIED